MHNPGHSARDMRAKARVLICPERIYDSFGRGNEWMDIAGCLVSFRRLSITSIILSAPADLPDILAKLPSFRCQDSEAAY